MVHAQHVMTMNITINNYINIILSLTKIHSISKGEIITLKNGNKIKLNKDKVKFNNSLSST